MKNQDMVLTADDKNMAAMTMFNGGKIDFRKYRSFEILPRQAWEYLDEVVVRVAKEELNGIADLEAASGLTINFDGMSASMYTKRLVSGMGEARMSMTPDGEGAASRLDEKQRIVPLPVTHKDYYLNSRNVAMATRIGYPIDMTSVEEATRSVARKLEDTLFNGNFTVGTGNIYGYTTFPSRNTYTITESWTAAGKTPDEVLADVNNMLNLAYQDSHFGPFILYIPKEYQVVLNKDYYIATLTIPAMSIKRRLLELTNLQDIKVSNHLANDNVVLVELSSSTIQLINGMSIRTLAWEPEGTPNWDHKYKVMAMQVPMTLADYDGNCGIVHGSV